MIKNYLRTAWRNLLNNKFYSAINIAGLTIGLTVGLLVLLWVNDELSFDSFNTKASQIYKVNAQIGTGSSEQVWSGVQGPIATFAMKEVPGVVNAVRLTKCGYSFFRYKNQVISEGNDKLKFTDPSLFKVFDYRLLKGSLDNPFPTDNSVILTESTAKKFFGDDNPIGKVLLADHKDNFVVNGIVADFPGNSSIKGHG